MDTYSAFFGFEHFGKIGGGLLPVYRRIKEHTHILSQNRKILALLIENGRFIYQPLK